MVVTTVPAPATPFLVPYSAPRGFLLNFHLLCNTLVPMMWVFLNHRQYLSVFMVSCSPFIGHTFKPLCVTADNMEVIPTSQHEKYTLIENFISGHSFSGIDGGFAHVLKPTHETVTRKKSNFVLKVL